MLSAFCDAEIFPPYFTRSFPLYIQQISRSKYSKFTLNIAGTGGLVPVGTSHNAPSLFFFSLCPFILSSISLSRTLSFPNLFSLTVQYVFFLHCNENPIYVCERFIFPRIGLHIFLQQNRQNDPGTILEMCKSLTDI